LLKQQSKSFSLNRVISLKYTFPKRYVGYAPVFNDEYVMKEIEETICEVFRHEALELRRPIMASDDFSAFQQKSPGTYFWVGAGNEKKE
jgi:amidohydrolase